MGKWRALTIDLDKGVDAERFDALLSHSMESKQKIQQSMLSSVVSQIQQIMIQIKISLGFILGHTKPLKYIRSASMC